MDLMAEKYSVYNWAVKYSGPQFVARRVKMSHTCVC